MTGALEVLFADNHLLVVAKPAGVPTAPDASGDESLLERAKAWVKRQRSKPGEVYLGLVHRLDRPVSGVVVFARTSKAAARLAEQFRVGGAQKRYLGVVAGRPAAEEGVVEQWLWKDEARNRVHVVAEGREGARLARTRWRLLRTEGGRALLALEPETGRAHQLRVACASLGLPLLGDLKYGAAEPLADKSVALHALELVLAHPTRKEDQTFRAEPPDAEWWRIAR